MREIKAIETAYNGYRFRSRLEAKWAVLFNTLGIRYRYEPEGYELPDGSRYLPDFVLYGGAGRCPDPLYVEVKGEMTRRDAEKIRLFAGLCPKGRCVSSCEECEYCSCRMDRDHKGYSYLCRCGFDIDTFDSGIHPVYGNVDCEEYIRNPIYVVTDIPEKIEEIANGEDVKGMDISYFNFMTVDGDYFGAVLGAQKGGGWSLFGADNNYWAAMDIPKTQDAYAIARQARFEHGETPQV